MCRWSSVELESLKNGKRPAERPSADLVEREAVEPDRRRVVAEPGPHAAAQGTSSTIPCSLHR